MGEAEVVTRQLLGELTGLGFVSDNPAAIMAAASNVSVNSPWRRLCAAVCAAFYPMVAKIERPAPTYVEGISGATKAVDKARDIRYFVQELEGKRWSRHRAFLHPGSGLFHESTYAVPYVVFSAKQVQEQRNNTLHPTRLVLSEASECSVVALLLFCGSMHVDHQQCQILLDGWVRVRSGSIAVGGLVERMRLELEAVLLKKINDPSTQICDLPIVTGMVELIDTDGMGN